MSKKQFPKVNLARGAPMGRRDDGVVADCVPRTVRLFKVALDSQGYDDGGAYWGHGGALWCAVGEHECGLPAQQFIRADSREAAIVGLNIEAGLLVQGPKFVRLNRLFMASQWGNQKAKDLISGLESLGYDCSGYGYPTTRANGF